MYGAIENGFYQLGVDRRMDVRETREHARDRNEWRMIVTQF